MIKESSIYNIPLIITLFIILSIVIYLLPLFILGNVSWTFVLSWLPACEVAVNECLPFLLMMMIWLAINVLTRHPKVKYQILTLKQ